MHLMSGVPGGVGKWKSAIAELGNKDGLGSDSARLLALGGNTGDPKSLLGLGEGEGEGEGELESFLGLGMGEVHGDSRDESCVVDCGLPAVPVNKRKTNSDTDLLLG